MSIRRSCPFMLPKGMAQCPRCDCEDGHRKMLSAATALVAGAVKSADRRHWLRVEKRILADLAAQRIEARSDATPKSGGDVKQAPAESPQSGHEVATPNPVPSHIPLMNKEER